MGGICSHIVAWLFIILNLVRCQQSALESCSAAAQNDCIVVCSSVSSICVDATIVCPSDSKYQCQITCSGVGSCARTQVISEGSNVTVIATGGTAAITNALVACSGNAKCELQCVNNFPQSCQKNTLACVRVQDCLYDCGSYVYTFFLFFFVCMIVCLYSKKKCKTKNKKKTKKTSKCLSTKQ